MSEESTEGFPPVQLSTFIKNDQFVFRAASGEELKDTLVGFAENTEDILGALNTVKDVVIAKSILTSSDTQSGGAKPTGNRPPAKKVAGRARDASPPKTDRVEFFEGEDGKSYATLECDHGPRLDLRDQDFKYDLYCTLQTKNWKEKCPPIKL